MDILLIEDDAELGKFVARSLIQDGHCVNKSFCGADGLRLALANRQKRARTVSRIGPRHANAAGA
jgi:hypothetical protein